MTTTTQETPRDLSSFVRAGTREHTVSRMARGLVGSEILRIAGEIRALVRDGRQVLNLTVGDFDPRAFPIPKRLEERIVAALARGETNYPPSDGVPELRRAVARFYARELALSYPEECVLVAGGARPLLYGVFRTLLDPGERVVYPVPSWNNNHYAHLAGAAGVTVACTSRTRFLPTRAELAPVLSGARLLCLNSPLNPSGTAFGREDLAGICDLVRDENRERERTNKRALYLMYDQVYWLLCTAGTEHVTPPGIDPELARWTILVDGISKSFAATGVRVGWAVGPAAVIERMSAVLGHVGAWAPRAEQVATAEMLDDPAAVEAFLAGFLPAVARRLELLHEGLEALRSEGLPVESLSPMEGGGGIYLTARIAPFGRRTREGQVLRTGEDVRRFLLDAAGIAVVPFQAFGVETDEGWVRLSVGAASPEAIVAALPRLGRALRELE